MFRTYLVVLGLVLIPLIVRTDSGHQNSEIYHTTQIRVLHLSTWLVILRTYDIRYVPRIALKGQVLADLIAELKPLLEAKIKQKATWNVWVDGAAGTSRSRIRIILEGL